ncbi:MAG: hypothetical protein ACR2IE_06345 [Candidatus Sumerlaeaceae bacterium]
MKKATKKRDPNVYPEGWNRKRVEAVIRHYESQRPEEAAAEDDAAFQSKRITFLGVPTEMVAQVHQLVERELRSETRTSKTNPQRRATRARTIGKNVNRPEWH